MMKWKNVFRIVDLAGKCFKLLCVVNSNYLKIHVTLLNGYAPLDLLRYAFKAKECDLKYMLNGIQSMHAAPCERGYLYVRKWIIDWNTLIFWPEYSLQEMADQKQINMGLAVVVSKKVKFGSGPVFFEKQKSYRLWFLKLISRFSAALASKARFSLFVSRSEGNLITGGSLLFCLSFEKFLVSHVFQCLTPRFPSGW